MREIKALREAEKKVTHNRFQGFAEQEEQTEKDKEKGVEEARNEPTQEIDKETTVATKDANIVKDKTQDSGA